METPGKDNNNFRQESYGECLRNHAAKLGVYTVDGCAEYTPDPSNPTTSLLHCIACGCHRNFHRKLSSTSSSIIGTGDNAADYTTNRSESGGRRRIRTKFSVEQKAKMAAFAERIGWRLRRREEIGSSSGDFDEVSRFCKEIGVSRQVFKVWLHNHKKSTAALSAVAAADATGEASNAASSSTSNATRRGDRDCDVDEVGVFAGTGTQASTFPDSPVN